MPCSLQFYIRETQNVGKFQVVNIQLKDTDIRNTIQTILTSCNLSTKYLDTICPQKKKEPLKTSRLKPKKYEYEYDIYSSVVVERAVKNAKENVTLR